MGEVTARMRQTMDVDAVLRTAAQEMRQALGLSAMAIRLMPPPEGDGQDRSNLMSGEI